MRRALFTLALIATLAATVAAQAPKPPSGPPSPPSTPVPEPKLYPVTATLAGDGAHLTWPGAGCAWHGSALLGCGVGGVRPGRDAANELRPGDLVVVRSLDGVFVGRARVRGLWYLPSTAKPPPM